MWVASPPFGLTGNHLGNGYEDSFGARAGAGLQFLCRMFPENRLLDGIGFLVNLESESRFIRFNHTESERYGFKV